MTSDNHESMHRRPKVDGDEQDYFTSWRRYYFWKRGQTKKLKRKVHKRERQQAKARARKHWTYE